MRDRAVVRNRKRSRGRTGNGGREHHVYLAALLGAIVAFEHRPVGIENPLGEFGSPKEAGTAPRLVRLIFFGLPDPMANTLPKLSRVTLRVSVVAGTAVGIGIGVGVRVGTVSVGIGVVAIGVAVGVAARVAVGVKVDAIGAVVVDAGATIAGGPLGYVEKLEPKSETEEPRSDQRIFGSGDL